jgi:hypothetical protein
MHALQDGGLSEAAMRELMQDGVEWRIHEADASRVPGARRSRCLIFDSDGVVRRVWAYPEDWGNLPDDRLWSLLDDVRIAPLRPTSEAEQSARKRVVGCVADLAREGDDDARSRFADVRADDAPPVSEQCRAAIDALRLAVRGYAETLRQAGVPPERAVVTIKAALRDGLDALRECGDVDEDEIVGACVAWGIESYYAG